MIFHLKFRIEDIQDYGICHWTINLCFSYQNKRNFWVVKASHQFQIFSRIFQLTWICMEQFTAIAVLNTKIFAFQIAIWKKNKLFIQTKCKPNNNTGCIISNAEIWYKLFKSIDCFLMSSVSNEKKSLKNCSKSFVFA